MLRAVRADRTERKPEGLRDDLEKTPLWNRAARLGHELAIANARYMSPEVVAHNPMQAYVRLARNTIESQRRSSPWGSHHAVAPGSSSQPISDDEFRDFLTDAGIPCRRPCTAKRLKEKKDDHSIMRRYREWRVLAMRKRGEAKLMSYVFALESLASARNIELDRRLVRRIADPDNPQFLASHEVHEARIEADRLVRNAEPPR